jgi:hypothetical protein
MSKSLGTVLVVIIEGRTLPWDTVLGLLSFALAIPPKDLQNTNLQCKEMHIIFFLDTSYENLYNKQCSKSFIFFYNSVGVLII